jgi:hypothetical protein
MTKRTDRSVFQRDDGKWVEKRNAAGKASSAHDKQSEAIREAREHLVNQGGGELTVMGRDHKIRSKDTIAPGNDPNPPTDREH